MNNPNNTLATGGRFGPMVHGPMVQRHDANASRLSAIETDIQGLKSTPYDATDAVQVGRGLIVSQTPWSDLADTNALTLVGRMLNVVPTVHSAGTPSFGVTVTPSTFEHSVNVNLTYTFTYDRSVWDPVAATHPYGAVLSTTISSNNADFGGATTVNVDDIPDSDAREHSYSLTISLDSSTIPFASMNHVASMTYAQGDQITTESGATQQQTAGGLIAWIDIHPFKWSYIATKASRGGNYQSTALAKSVPMHTNTQTLSGISVNLSSHDLLLPFNPGEDAIEIQQGANFNPFGGWTATQVTVTDSVGPKDYWRVQLIDDTRVAENPDTYNVAL